MDMLEVGSFIKVKRKEEIDKLENNGFITGMGYLHNNVYKVNGIFEDSSGKASGVIITGGWIIFNDEFEQVNKEDYIKMKCTVCGCEEYIPAKIHNDWVIHDEFKVSFNGLCCSCSHKTSMR